jgi:hypothetical protein
MDRARSTNGENRTAYRILMASQDRDHYKNQDTGGWTILKWILEKQDGMIWIGLVWLQIGTSGGLL